MPRHSDLASPRQAFIAASASCANVGAATGKAKVRNRAGRKVFIVKAVLQ
jgi:hypothetical protein